MKKLLCIQFRISEQARRSEQYALERHLGAGVIDFVDAFEGTCDWAQPARLLEAYDGFVFGGSGEFYFDGEKDLGDPSRARVLTVAHAMRPFIKHIIKNNIPALGICLGHQLFAHTLGVPVVRCRDTGKAGTFRVRLIAEGIADDLFRDFPEEFDAQYGHKDVVTALPFGAELLAQGDACQFAAIRFASRVYSVQFHPELSLADLEGRVAQHPDYLPDGVSFEDAFRDTPHATKVLENFGAIVAQVKQ